jgi:type I restriction enzyme S subunit
VLLRPNPAVVDGDYLLYLLLAPSTQDALRTLSEGSTVAHLNVADVRNFRITVPELYEQQAVAAVLRALDEKVASNRRLMALLDDTVTTLYRGYVRLFQGQPPANDTELGPLPAGWEVRHLGDLGTIRGGGTPSSKVSQYWEPGEVVWVTPKDMTALQAPVVYASDRLISHEGLQNSSAKLLPPGTVLYTSRATLGHVAIARTNLATNQGFIAIEPNAEYSSEFVLMTLRERNDAIISKANGSTFLEVNKTNFKAVPFIDPPASVRQRFNEAARPAFEKIETLDKEIRSLVSMRDGLLAKLAAGVLQVSGTDDPTRSMDAPAELVT